MAEGAEWKEQLGAWIAEKKQISAYAMNLQQIDNCIIIPPSGWKCAKCNKTENLWLNLTDGMILCGRRNWDGTGGNNHAVEHYKETGYPLAVKHGTITADLEAADVFSYPEDDSVLDPVLAQHLAFFGIDFSSLQKDECFIWVLHTDGAQDVLGQVGEQEDRTTRPWKVYYRRKGRTRGGAEGRLTSDERGRHVEEQEKGEDTWRSRGRVSR